MSVLSPFFCEQMRRQLGNEADAYFSCLNDPYCRGIRLNPFKHPTQKPDGLLEPIPWYSGFYLSTESNAGADILHEAGAWYLQEPSAMCSAAILKAAPGELVLDLCSAPGGKATQAAESMADSGLLVCNEPIPSRAKILSRNIERMGICNSLVISEMPEKLASLWPELFDAILVDAPCSGEGMFRRHPETREEWRPTSPEGCAERQRFILESAVKMLKPGGRLVYSTCTFNSTENEDICLWLKSIGMIPVPFMLNGNSGILNAPEGMLHLYPHRIKGEGHFAAFFLKPGIPAAFALLKPAAEQLSYAPKEAQAMLNEMKNAGFRIPDANACFGDTLVSCPDLPPLKGIHVLRAGLQLGQIKGKVFLPDHALALAQYDPESCPHYIMTENEARRYLHGEVINVPENLKGYILAVYAGLAVGFGKAANGQMKNHYPKGLRK